MTISRSLAESIAIKMTANLRAKESELTQQLSAILHGWVMSKVPEPVRLVFNSNDSKFIKTDNEVRLHGHGFNCDTHYLYERYPSVGYETRNITLTEEMAAQIRPLINAISDYKKEIKVLHDNIETALFNLKTKKRVEEQFPEAIPFFPEEKKPAAVMVDLTNIREFAKKQMESAA